MKPGCARSLVSACGSSCKVGCKSRCGSSAAQCRHLFLPFPLCPVVIPHFFSFCSPSNQWPSQTGQTSWAPSWLRQLFYHDEQRAGIQQLHRLGRRWQHQQVGHCCSDWAVKSHFCVSQLLVCVSGLSWNVLRSFIMYFFLFYLLDMIWGQVIHQ